MSNRQLTNFEKGKLREFALYRPHSYPELCTAYIYLNKSFDSLRAAMQTAKDLDCSLNFAIGTIKIHQGKKE